MITERDFFSSNRKFKRYKGCERKKGLTLKSCLAIEKKVLLTEGKMLKHYLCKYCGKFHLTSQKYK